MTPSRSGAIGFSAIPFPSLFSLPRSSTMTQLLAALGSLGVLTQAS